MHCGFQTTDILNLSKYILNSDVQKSKNMFEKIIIRDIFTKKFFIINGSEILKLSPVLKTEWQIRHSIIGERQETAYVLFCYKNGKSAVFKTGK